MGTTSFGGYGSSTGCERYSYSVTNPYSSSSSCDSRYGSCSSTPSSTTYYSIKCSSNTYTMSSRTAKARMITMQEARNAGCSSDSMSCPKWMYNYLYNSTSYNGTKNDTT